MQQRDNYEHKQSIGRTDDNEVKICEVAKHPFGIFSVYAMATVGLILVLGFAYFFLPTVVDDVDQAFLYANLFAVIAVVFSIIGVLISALVYRQNRLIVTDRNITQILQFGLFSRKVSQLNMVNVEDVTSVQKGLLPTMFGYGELKIETAGEQSNFNFTYCPRPNYYANIILNAREQILGQNGNNNIENSNLPNNN